MSKSEKRSTPGLKTSKEPSNPGKRDVETDPAVHKILAGPIRLFIADSSQTFREGLALAVQTNPDFQLIGQMELAEAVYAKESFLDADVGIVDVDLRDRSGIEVAHWLANQRPNMAVLLISHWDWDVYLAAAQAAGAAGLLLRSAPSGELMGLIHSAASGPIYSPGQLHRLHLWKKDVGDRLKKLSPREWEILWEAAAGHKNREIAEALSLSEKSVEKHVNNILEKIRLTSRSTMVAFIYLNHLDVLIRLPIERRNLYIQPAFEQIKN
jgi:DNA-binding NarL/FixJ family response regulator